MGNKCLNFILTGSVHILYTSILNQSTSFYTSLKEDPFLHNYFNCHAQRYSTVFNVVDESKSSLSWNTFTACWKLWLNSNNWLIHAFYPNLKCLYIQVPMPDCKGFVRTFWLFCSHLNLKHSTVCRSKLSTA